MDYETLTSKSFNFQVSVSDGASFDLQAIVIDIINVNEAPSFRQTAYALSASEGAVSSSIFSSIDKITVIIFKTISESVLLIVTSHIVLMSVVSWCSTCFCVVLCVGFCTGHFVMVPLNLTN